MVRFITDDRTTYGIEPIRRVLPTAQLHVEISEMRDAISICRQCLDHGLHHRRADTVAE